LVWSFLRGFSDSSIGRCGPTGTPVAARTMLAPERMIMRLLADPRLLRLGLVVLALVLAACNPGNNSGGGGPAY